MADENVNGASYSLPSINFDARLYHILAISSRKGGDAKLGDIGEDGAVVTNLDENGVASEEFEFANKGNKLFIYPYHAGAEFSSDYYESLDGVVERIAEVNAQIDVQNNADEETKSAEGYGEVMKALENERAELKVRYELIKDFIKRFKDQMVAPHSLIHPYAIVKLAGAQGSKDSVKNNFVFDSFRKRRWYEVDGDDKSSYASTPTTTKIIAWGTEDLEGRTPYSYQDFVFCKYWNVIPNNRMITLRRYFAPVTDNIEFENYKQLDSSADVLFEDAGALGNSLVIKEPKGKVENMGFSPLATAVTYFGENTKNDISKILNFSVNYKWKQEKAQSSPIGIEAETNDMGDGLIASNGFGILSGAMKAFSYMTGFSGALKGDFNPMAEANNTLPPDPYTQGPYENRILGPINVIMDTWRRDRGLEFKQDGLSITFSYVSRPIAGINNKAVLLDLLSNMLVMCYSSGTWFGGLERFRSNPKSAYPFKYGDVMNKLYKGQLFGKNSATTMLRDHFFEGVSGQYGLMDMFGEMLKDVKNLVSSAFNSLMSVVHGVVGNKEKSEQEKADADKQRMEAFSGKAITGVQKILAGRILKGAQIPWVNGKKALLTGDPVGEWHLTIGNPLNPIAMIGNLICDGLTIEWSNELGPDDFPIGFDATVSLKHGLGRDKDAVESMFNRGYGRIYSLPNTFRSSADFETQIDQYTGRDNHDPTKYDEWSEKYYGDGGVYMGNIVNTPLANRGDHRALEVSRYQSLIPTNAQSRLFRNSVYVVTPFQMKWLM